MRILVLVVALTTACGSARSPASRPEAAQLEVDNRRFLDMVIYVVDGAQRVRLGTATGNLTTKMRIPTTLVATGREIRFLADPIGGPSAGVSEQIYVRPGQVVRLTIPP